GRVAIELVPAFAPRSVAQIKRLVRSGFYDGLSFYRVIENFVAQGGIGEGSPAHRKVPTLPAEFTFPAAKATPFMPVQKPEIWANETGFWQGFAIGRDPATGRAWAIHCPGVFALARDADPDTSSSEFYIAIGEAPRHLDRNLTVLGRVIAGMRFVQAAPRGDREVNSGVIPPGRPQLRIRRAMIAADLPDDIRPAFHVMRTDTAEFRARIEAQRRRDNPFWVVRPVAHLDICTVPVPVR
ncbi:MAG: peptidylprolyl isomerase, partial [Alphaproteobacteria bacterium]